MRKMLLATAAAFAALAIAGAAQAQRWTDPDFLAAANVTVHRGSSGTLAESSTGPLTGQFRQHHRDGNGHFRGDRRSFDDGVFVGPWAYDYQDRTFEPDSYNDWWHDRPDRAYPRWVRHNEGCDPDRMWQGGGAWRCSW